MSCHSSLSAIIHVEGTTDLGGIAEGSDPRQSLRRKLESACESRRWSAGIFGLCPGPFLPVLLRSIDAAEWPLPFAITLDLNPGP